MYLLLGELEPNNLAVHLVVGRQQQVEREVAAVQEDVDLILSILGVPLQLFGSTGHSFLTGSSTRMYGRIL